MNRFVQISDYCIIEYIFGDINASDVIKDDFFVLRNSVTDLDQVFNANPTINTSLLTNNIQDYTVIYVDGNRFVLDDSRGAEQAYHDFAGDHMSITRYTSQSIQYDTIRLHFISGFDFANFDALIFQLRSWQNNEKYCYLANVLIDAATASKTMYFNPRPMFITDAFYDRYIEIKAPSILNVNNRYYNRHLVQSQQLGAYFTPNGDGTYAGLKTNAPLGVVLHECNAGTDILNTNDNENLYVTYVSSNSYQTAIPQISEFDGFSLYIEEATDGDYIQYGGLYNDGPVSDFITQLNSRNAHDNWILIHQLLIYEKLDGGSEVLTKKMMDVQEDSFDVPNDYRPILKHSGRDTAFSVDYLCRLMNKFDGQQVLATASFTSFSPTKYGKEPQIIKLDGYPNSYKIYNKIVKSNYEATNQFVEPTLDQFKAANTDSTGTVVEKQVYVPVFFNSNKISVAQRSSFTTTNTQNTELIYGQGAIRMLLSPFDNVFNFKFYDTNSGTPVPLNLDFGATKFNIVFIDDRGARLSFESTNDTTNASLKAGEVSFKIPKSNSEAIILFSSRAFYITSNTVDNRETMMYPGFWVRIDEYDQITNAETQAKAGASASSVMLPSVGATTTASTSGVDIPGYIPK